MRTAVNRPTTVNCDICGGEVQVKPTGAVPRYCPAHKDPQLRRQMVAAAETKRTVCRWEHCSIPLAAEWPNEFCPNHWRLLSLDVRGELIDQRRDGDGYDIAVLGALREIRRYEGRAQLDAEKLADQTEVG
jgi:hypothetical protein